MVLSCWYFVTLIGDLGLTFLLFHENLVEIFQQGNCA